MLPLIFCCAALMAQSPENPLTVGVSKPAVAPLRMASAPRAARGAAKHAARQSAETEIALITAQGSPYLAEFQALCGKRADLCASMGRNGIDAAFSQWLYSERTAAYRRYLRDSQNAH